MSPRACWAFVLLPLGWPLVGPAAGQAGDPVGEGARFEALAREHQAHRSLSWQQVLASLSRYGGETVVVAGALRGQITTSNGTLLILHLDDGSRLQTRLTDAHPSLTVGARLRLLVRVGPNGEADLLATCSDADESVPPSSASQEAPASGPGSPLPESYARTALSSEVGERLSRALRSQSRPASRPAQDRPPARSAPPSRGNAPGGAIAEARAEWPQVLQVIRSFNGKLPEATAQEIAGRLLHWSRAFGLRWQFLAALVAAESNFNPNATSRVGAQGLGQLMPGTAKSLGVTNAYDIDENLYGAARYIRAQLDRYRDRAPNEQFALALAAYNAGPGAVSRHGGIPPYRETVGHIRRVADYYMRFCRETDLPY